MLSLLKLCNDYLVIIAYLKMRNKKTSKNTKKRGISII